MTNQLRLAGTLILLGILAALIWRIGIAPSVLGDFDPTDMPHRDRAFLAIGNIAVGLLFTAAFWNISRDLASTGGRKLAGWAVIAAVAGVASSTVGTIALIWTNAGIHGLNLYVACTVLAFALIAGAAFREYRGGLRWTAIFTGVVYVLAGMAIIGGVHIIFVMTIAALPFAITLIVRGSASEHSAVMSERAPSAA